jgi:hypothetical protein
MICIEFELDKCAAVSGTYQKWEDNYKYLEGVRPSWKYDATLDTQVGKNECASRIFEAP